MRRVITIVALALFVPAAAAAQTAPPPPPTPPPSPTRVPPSELPPLPQPAPPPSVEWTWPDVVMPAPAPMPPMPVEWAEMADRARFEAERAMDIWEQSRELAIVAPEWRGLGDFDFVPMARGFGVQGSEDASAYNSAMSSLSRRDYDTAVTRFDRVVAMKGAHADAALHWKAFAQFKLGRSDDALATIATLRSSYPQSRYLNDAKVLEADVRATAGQPVDPAAIDDDELKLLAIQGLQRSDPEGSVPLLEGVLAANNSLRVKERALYVLALSDSARAHEILMRYATGGGNPDLQLRAISYLASRRDEQTTSADLQKIYQSTEDASVRMAVINAYRSAGDREALVSVVRRTGEPVAIRSRAVSNLASMAAPQDIWTLYQSEENPQLRAQMVSAFNSMKAVDQLVQAARTDRDADVKQRAIRYLGNQDAEATGKVLTDLYSVDDEVDTRRAIIRALAEQDNAEALVAIARKDASPETIRDVVTLLSRMAARSEVAKNFLAEIIKR